MNPPETFDRTLLTGDSDGSAKDQSADRIRRDDAGRWVIQGAGGRASGLPPANWLAMAAIRRQSSRTVRSRRSCISCASRLSVAVGRASSRFRLIGSPVISQKP